MKVILLCSSLFFLVSRKVKDGFDHRRGAREDQQHGFVPDPLGGHHKLHGVVQPRLSDPATDLCGR